MWIFISITYKSLHRPYINVCIDHIWISQINQPHKTINHKRQDILWENPLNMEDEKTSNSLTMIDRFVEDGLQHIRKLPDKRYHLNNKEEIRWYNCMSNLRSAWHFNNKLMIWIQHQCTLNNSNMLSRTTNGDSSFSPYI